MHRAVAADVGLWVVLCCGLAGCAARSGPSQLAPSTQPADGQAAGQWLQWRGPTRDGRVAADVTFPESLQDDRLQLLWRAEIAEGYSSPIVTADRIFTVETLDKQTEIVRAFNRATGRQIWATDWAGSMKVPFFAARTGSWVRSTPACDGRYLYVGGMRDVLVCLDIADGKVRWKVDFMARYGTPLPSFGLVCSPLVVGDHLYIQAGASLVKLDKHTGNEVWRTLEDGGAMMGSAFSSPMPARLCGKDQVIVQTRRLLAGVDPDTGRVLWSTEVEASMKMNILNPAVIEGDRVFTSTYGGGSMVYAVTRDGEKWSVTQVLQSPVQGYMSTPIILGGHAYLHRRNQKLSCLNLLTGQEMWTTAEKFGEYSSLITDGNRILGLSCEGELYLFVATPEKFDLLDTRQISQSPTWAHVTVCGDQLIVRELKGLAVYRWR